MQARTNTMGNCPCLAAKASRDQCVGESGSRDIASSVLGSRLRSSIFVLSSRPSLSSLRSGRVQMATALLVVDM